MENICGWLVVILMDNESINDENIFSQSVIARRCRLDTTTNPHVNKAYEIFWKTLHKKNLGTIVPELKFPIGKTWLILHSLCLKPPDEYSAHINNKFVFNIKTKINSDTLNNDSRSNKYGYCSCCCASGKDSKEYYSSLGSYILQSCEYESFNWSRHIQVKLLSFVAMLHYENNGQFLPNRVYKVRQ